MSLVDVWFMQAVQRIYEPWTTDNRVIPRAERDRARERVTAIRRQLAQLPTQSMPAIH